MLMFGQEPQIPVDFLLGQVQEQDGAGVCQWIQEHQKRLQVAFHCARERIKTAAQIRKERHDNKVRDDHLEERQLVYLQNHSHQGRDKIQDAWSSVLYKIVKAPAPDGAVYPVAPLHDTTQRCQVHQTMLKLVPPSLCPQLHQTEKVPLQGPRDDGDLADGFWVIRSSRHFQQPSDQVIPMAHQKSPMLQGSRAPLQVPLATEATHTADY